jgi:hypothetical protein
LFLIVDKKHTKNNIKDYSVLDVNGGLSKLLFHNTTSPTVTTPIKKAQTTITPTSNKTPISDSISCSKNDFTYKEAYQDISAEYNDPLHLLMKVAVSFPIIPSIQTKETKQQHLTIVHMNSIITSFDFVKTPRINPISSSTIQLRPDTTTISEQTKWSILVCAIECGYENLSCCERIEMIDTISTYHSFMGGYKYIIGGYKTFRKWYCAFNDTEKRDIRNCVCE